STWTLRRLAVAEAQVWIYQIEGADNLSPNAPLGQALHNCDRTLSRLQRIVNGTQRNYRDALHELERLQALELDLDPLPPPQRVAPEPEPEPGLTPSPTPQPAESEPVSLSLQFVPSSSPPLPPAPQRGPPKKAPLPHPRERLPL
ncbi:MAG: hypothetical protein LAQ69_49205, partial [Acidobacteriia bacterium]|nr:hypothetical protein [Terriglobia bacterium]